MHGTNSQHGTLSQRIANQQQFFVGFTAEERDRLKALGFVGVEIIENLLKQKQLQLAQRNQG